MKFVSSLVLAFLAACLGWSFVATGPLWLGLSILAACVVYAYGMTIHLTFGSFRNFVEEVKEWDLHSLMIR